MVLTVGAGQERVLQKCLVTGPSMTAPSSPLQARLPTDIYQCSNLFSKTTNKEEEACCCIGVEHIHDHGSPLHYSAFTLEAPKNNYLVSFTYFSAFRVGDVNSSPLSCLATIVSTPPADHNHELCPRPAFRVSSGTVCERWMLVFTLIKRNWTLRSSVLEFERGPLLWKNILINAITSCVLQLFVRVSTVQKPRGVKAV